MPTVADYYALPAQYSLEEYTTATPEGDQQAVSYAPGYLQELLALRQRVLSGQATGWDRENYEQQANAARAIPMRDVSGLTYNAGEEGTGQYVSGGSPDLGNLMLTLAEKMEAGTASPQEAQLFETTYKALADQNWRASVPQESDRFSIMGDNLLSALGILGLGASGGLAAGALAGGGLGLGATLGASGTLAGIGGTGASTLGGALKEPILQQAGLALGALGGVAGGAGGLANLWGTGVQSLGDAARLASSAGKVTGALGAASGVPGLQQAGRYLGLAGNLGQAGSDLSAGNLMAGAGRLGSVLGQGAGLARQWGGSQQAVPQRPPLVRDPAPAQQAAPMRPPPAPLPPLAAPPGGPVPQPNGIQQLLAAAQMAQRGGQMPDWRSILMRGAA